MSDSESSAWKVTQRFRKDGWPGVQEWLVISSDHSGNPIGKAKQREQQDNTLNKAGEDRDMSLI